MKKKSIRFIAALLSLVMVISLLPANGMTAEAAAKPKLVKKTASIVVGGTAQAKLKNVPKGAKVTYKSAKKSIATVSKSGKVKGIKDGTAKIIVSIKKKSKAAKLTYKVTVKKPGLSKTKVSMVSGKTVSLSVKNRPKKAKYTWKSSNPKIAAVSKNGKVTAKAKGTAAISLKIKTAKKTYSLSCKVTVKLKLNHPNPTKKTYTVIFDSNGGSIVSPQSVTENGMAKEPVPPTREGYSFGGWYTAANGGVQFDFNTKVTGNLTLYAHWSSLNNVKKTYTVTFDSNGGSQVSPQVITENERAVKPADPSKEGCIFEGWYTAATDGAQFDFNMAITSDLTLYAHWNNPNPNNETYRVTFDLNDGSSGIYQAKMLKAGTAVDRPADPARELYRFTGWYMEPASVTEYDFSKPVSGDLTLYAGWGNPDGSRDDLYAASNQTETIYSITGVEVIGGNVAVTYNTNAQCLMTVEFFEDQVSGSDWSEAAQASNLDAAPIAIASGYTESYGEMASITLPIEGALPEHFVVRATLHGTGEDENPTYVSNQYTATYKEFEAQTVDSVVNEYGEDSVINFDNDRTTNFGVLKDSVKIIKAVDFVNGFQVSDVGGEDEIVPDHNFIFAGASEEIQSLQVGDVIYLEGTTWLFKVKTVSKSDDGTVTLTQDKDATMTDFYDVLQVDMESSDPKADIASDNSGISTQWEIIDVDTSLSGAIGPLKVSKKFENGITLSGSIEGKITGKVKMSYDAKLFSADYFESSVSFETEISSKLEAGMANDNSNEWKNVVYQFDTRGIKLPTPITGLDVYVKPAAKLDWSLSGSVAIEIKTKQTSGFNYNSDTGRTDIKKKENTVSIMAKGKAEIKVGPNIDIGVELLGGVLSAGVTAEAGAKFTATAETGADDITNRADSKHACGLCVSGEAKWYATAGVKLSYKITNSLKGDIAKVTILNVEAPIYFLPGVPAKFFVSVINAADSPFEGRVKFGGGSCINKAYRTEIQVLDENSQQVTGTPVSIVRQGHTSESSGMSPYVAYLYTGTYRASASLNGTSVSKTFVVSENRQTVPLSLLSADSMLEGIVVNANDNSAAIDGASVKVSKDGVVVASDETDSSGKFSIAVPDGSVKVEISKDGYLPFVSMATVYDGENQPMGMIQLTPGTGMGGFHGVIRDATDNSPISGVTLNLYKGWNSTAEANTAIRTLATNSNGEFRYDTVTLFGKTYGLPSGNYTLTASKSGYSDTSYNIVIYPGTTDENPGLNETMSPSMSEGYYRIILTWGSTPSDLDSHLVADTDMGSDIHVYYRNMDPSPRYANLDTDDTDSYGPETITITNFEGLSNIRYAVHDYTNANSSSSTEMSYSNAIVRIFKGNQLLRTFQVPTGYGGTEWDVFSLDSNGRITTVNSMKYTEESDNVLGNGHALRQMGVPAPLKDYEVSGKAE